MGQRHQLFVIAKVNGRYRCLCAIHHQWLYGITAIKRCLGLIEIFQSPENHWSIEQELLFASKQDEEIWVPRDPRASTYVPFPSIATCLVIGASFNAAEGYYHHVSVEQWGMAYDEGDNNDGITIIDITDLSHVRYCFVDFHGMESQKEVQLMTPLPASVYLDAYYPKPKPEQQQNFEPYLKEFENRDVIIVDALRDTWPDGDWEEPGGKAEKESVELNRIEHDLPTVPTLESKALDQLIDSLINDPEGSENSVLPEAVLVASFLPRLKEKIYEHADSLRPSLATARLLFKALEREKTVDLAPFLHLGADTVSNTVRELQKHGQMTGVSLSNSSIKKEDLMEIFASRPALEALYLLGTPDLSTDSVKAVIDRHQLEVQELFHTDLMKDPFIEVWNGAEDYEEEKKGEEKDTGPRFVLSHHVIELFWVSVGYTEKRPTDWSKLRSEDTRDGYGWSKSNMTYVSFPFGDTPLSMARLLTGLINVFMYASRATLGTNNIGPVLSRCFATGKPSVSSEPRIAPLSTSIVKGKSRPKNTLATLPKGKFAILAIDDCHDAYDQGFLENIMGRHKDTEVPVKHVRYAIVTPKANEDDFEILDVPHFLKRISQVGPDAPSVINKDMAEELDAYWKQQINDIGTIKECSVDEAGTIARKVFGKEQGTVAAATASTMGV